MRSTTRLFGTLSTLLVAGFVAHASAQETRTLSAPPTSPAAQLEQQAYQPVQNGNWLPSAKELEQAASLRAMTDPIAVTDLMTAATLYTSMHRADAALPLLEEAGRRAELIGANELAFRAYVAGLGVAEDQDNLDQVHFYVARIEGLAGKPGVTADEQKAVKEAAEEAEAEW